MYAYVLKFLKNLYTLYFPFDSDMEPGAVEDQQNGLKLLP